MTMLHMIIRHLVRQRARSLLTLFGLALTCGACFAILGVVYGFERSIVGGLEEPGADFIVGPRGSFSLVGGSVPQALGGKLAAMAEVASATPVLFNVMTVDRDQNLVVAGRPREAFSQMQIRQLNGRMPEANESNVLVLGEGVAKTLSKKPGDTIEIEFAPYRIVGVAEFGSYMYRNIAIMPLADLQALLRRPNSASFIEVRLKRPIDRAALPQMQAELAAISAPYDVLDTDDFVKSIRMISIVRSVANTITVIMLLLTLMIVANTMLMSVNERTYEFGVLAALGWTPRRIMGLVLSEGFALTVTGGLAGLLLGVAFMAIASMVSRQAYLSPSFTVSMIAQIVAAVIVAGIAGALYPARKAVRMNAVEALRKA